MKQLQTSRKRRYALAIILAISITLLTSCQSLAVGKNLEWKTFPNPYDEEGNPYLMYDVETDRVSMPLSYWLEVTEYVIDTEKNIRIITE